MDRSSVLSHSLDTFIQKLHASLDGLSSKEALKREKKYGKNTLRSTRISWVFILVSQCKSSLVYLLIIAAGLSFLLKDASDGIVISILLCINTLLGFYQEYKSEKAIEKLSKLIPRECAVYRDGKLIVLEEKYLVPGDLVIIKEGDVVPADMLLSEALCLQVNESQLTGESAFITKMAASHTVTKNNLVFAGSTIEKGEGKAIVYATGYATQLGHIASLSSSTKKITQYEKSLQRFSNYILRITFFTLAIVFVAKLLISHDITHLSSLFLFIIALAVTIVPEALPVIATVTLARGALKLATKHVIVKRLSSVEDLGNITLLCTDKTGTLTQNVMNIVGFESPDPELFQILTLASVGIHTGKRKRVADPYDEAFIHFVPTTLQEKAAEYRQIAEIAFDPMLRRRSILLQHTKTKKQYLVVLGAVEAILTISLCSNKATYHRQHELLGSQGIRSLAMGYKEVSSREAILEQNTSLHFLGFVKLVDPLRPTTKQTIEQAEKLGIAIKILTGDTKEVAGFIGREIGLLSVGEEVYTGDDLGKLSHEHFVQAVLSSSVFAQVTPEQKYTIIKTLKEHYVVGYQGDGINDAPSLKLADVGIAVNTASDVAKESSEILLLRSDLEVIINGIKYGRTIFVNINKYIKYTMIGNFGNFFALAGLYLLSTDLPLLPVQLLLTSVLTDLPHLFIYSDTVNASAVRKPQHFNIHALLFLSLFLGVLTSLFEFIFFAVVRTQPIGFIQTTLFLFLTFIQLCLVFSVRNRDYFWKGKRPSLLLSLSTLGIFLCAIALLYIPFLSKIFSLNPVPLHEIAVLILLTQAYFLSVDIVKVWYYSLLGEGV